MQQSILLHSTLILPYKSVFSMTFSCLKYAIVSNTLRYLPWQFFKLDINISKCFQHILFISTQLANISFVCRISNEKEKGKTLNHPGGVLILEQFEEICVLFRKIFGLTCNFKIIFLFLQLGASLSYFNSHVGSAPFHVFAQSAYFFLHRCIAH